MKQEKNYYLITVLTLLLLSGKVCAEDESSEEGTEEAPSPPPVEAIYIPLKPAFVVNYGGVGRLKYLKAEISLRLGDSKTANSVRHHMPYIRNNLVLLFSRQTDDTIDTVEGKELLRQQALSEIKEILLTEDNEANIVDLYFNNFIIQK